MSVKTKWREWLAGAGAFLAPKHNRSPGTGPGKSRGALSGLVLLFFAGVGLMLLAASATGPRHVEGDAPLQDAGASRQVTPSLTPATRDGVDGAFVSSDAARGEEEAYRRGLVDRLKGILSAIDGAGEVNVEVALATSTRNEYAFRENVTERRTDEKDSSGGSRVTSESTKEEELAAASTFGSGGGGGPVVVVSRRPEIAGVVVVADGARDGAIRERLSRAVQTLLGVPAHRVEVFARGR